MTGIIERSGIDLLLLDGDGTSPFGAGVMGKMGGNGEEFCEEFGSISPRISPFFSKNYSSY